IAEVFEGRTRAQVPAPPRGAYRLHLTGVDGAAKARVVGRQKEQGVEAQDELGGMLGPSEPRRGADGAAGGRGGEGGGSEGGGLLGEEGADDQEERLGDGLAVEAGAGAARGGGAEDLGPDGATGAGLGGRGRWRRAVAGAGLEAGGGPDDPRGQAARQGPA